MATPLLLDEAYRSGVADVRSRLVAYAAAVWATLGFTDSAMAALVAAMVPKVLAGQMRVANLTSAYLAKTADNPAVPVSPLVTQGRGVDPKVVYGRPIIATRAAVSQGKPVAEAMEVGARRLESLVTTDVQMAKVRQADVSLRAAGRTFYRRVPQGESSCAMCLIASTQRYTVSKLLPIHPGCDCDVKPLAPGDDLDAINIPNLLEATHAKVEDFAGVSDRGGRAPDYRKLLVTHEHGELGDVIAWRGQNFTGPADIAGLTG